MSLLMIALVWVGLILVGAGAFVMMFARVQWAVILGFILICLGCGELTGLAIWSAS